MKTENLKEREYSNEFSLGHRSLRVPESHNPADHVIAKLSVNNETIEDDIKRINVAIFSQV